MNMRPGVVLSVFNEGHILQQTLPQLTQQFEEIVIIDNQSEDDTSRVCQSFPVRWIPTNTPLTRGECWNEGAHFIQSEAILFLHADVRIPAEALVRWEQVWATQACDYSCFQIQFQEPSWNYRLLEDFSNFRSGNLRIIYGDQGLCVRRSVFEKIGGFPEVHLLEDLKINSRLRGYRFGYIPSPIYPATRKFHKIGFYRYLYLMNKVLFLNGIGADSKTLYRLYYRK